MKLTVEAQEFPIEGGFTISRGTRTHAKVVVATVSEGDVVGRGECVPYPRYGESVEGVAADIEKMANAVSGGLTPQALQQLMPAGAARCALDSALWDFTAKKQGTTVAQLLGIAPLKSVTTAFTISVGTPEKMAADAAKAAHRPLLKVKLAGDGDVDRITAVRAVAPNSRLIVDANEAWTEANLEANMRACFEAGVGLVEQPLPADNDAILGDVEHLIPICADESLHTSKDLEHLRGRYSAVNIKMDKTGGLTEAMILARKAKEMDFVVMVGCMLGTSLGMAPAFHVAQEATFVDLDGPLLLSKDRDPGFTFDGSIMMPPPPALWG
ncbi:dipeptide epimerase [Rhodobacteraceae bacterium RKSG542]|uniref:N-acetyl-D-Glu racemase DgcA n=1 Tax=Pseudovibrio flavus TaxID=2529854 RepID=UPI0012BB87FC|nr:N-acetyl-D-Glu racemase DgcA [Pseudovibrio flavus]MTI19235.1 dipeptide epimerase [Pseudovibrio flavus]